MLLPSSGVADHSVATPSRMTAIKPLLTPSIPKLQLRQNLPAARGTCLDGYPVLRERLDGICSGCMRRFGAEIAS